MQVETLSFELPLKHTFTISRESYALQPTLIVRLSEGDCQGFGEATSNRYYGHTIDSMRSSVASVAGTLGDLSLDDVSPDQVWDRVAPALRDDPFALCAIDQAVHDLWGKRLGRPTYQLWGLTTQHVPASSFTIGIDTIDRMVGKLQEEPGWPIYKIKLGTPEDVQIIRELRRHTDAVFRVDANCAWTADQCLRN